MYRSTRAKEAACFLTRLPPDFYRVKVRNGVRRSVYACTDLYGPIRAYKRGKNQVGLLTSQKKKKKQD